MTTKIEWADDTVNPWWGCVKASPACDSCYAERISDRFGQGQHLWGPNSQRLIKDDLAIESLHKIARKSDREGRPRRVFIESMGDFFEDHPMLDEPRKRFWDEILAIGSRIIPMFLTKRVTRMLKWSKEMGWPEWAWALATVENQKAADGRIPYLLGIDAPVRGVSVEPTLGPIDLRDGDWDVACSRLEWLHGTAPIGRASEPQDEGLSWIIVGAETGPGARPMNPKWAEALRDQCREAKVPFFFKKASNGSRLLEGREWNEFPEI